MKPLACLLICSAVALAQNPLDPAAAEWKSAAPMALSLQRTPPLYPTDAPAAIEIPSVQAQILHTTAGNFVRLEWADKTHDTTVLPKAERAWQGDHLVTQSAATDRFSDACAVMIPAKPVTGDLNPSLQMGDADHPVRIFVWDSTRGAAVMEASGRETTKRTGQSFPAQGSIRQRQMGGDPASPGSEGRHSVRRRHLEWFAAGSRRQKVLHDMVSSTVNTWAVFRFALGYPDERHLERFAELCETVPDTLAELRSLYIDLFEAGLPQPRCPLLESAWLLNRPAGDVVLENKLYYQTFGLEIDGRAAPDHLLTQLEFLAWLDHCEAAGNADVESVQRARAEFLERHLSHWVGSLAHLSENSGGGCYAELLEALAREVESALS